MTVLRQVGVRMAGHSVQKRERNRCAEIVREQRYKIERALIASAIATKNKLYTRRFIQILTEIEDNILDMPRATAETIQYQGDFSTEEMERAQSIIEEQERNPFEG